MVAFEQGCPHRKRLEEWFARRGTMPERTIEMTSYHAMLGCVVAGMGISLLPRSVLSTFPERGRLRVHALPKGYDTAMTALFWRKDARSSKIAALVDILAESTGSGRRRKVGQPP
jgi:DNA-binding transcriptional LysR family regulator